MMRHWLATLAVLGGLAAASTAAQEYGPRVNLIAAEGGGRVVAVSSESRRGVRELLNDGDAQPASTFSFADRAPHPQAVTFAFAKNGGGRLRRIVINQPASRAAWFRDRFIGTFELQASRVSSTSGFEKVGTFTCDPDGSLSQSFDLGGQDARFVRLVVRSNRLGSGGIIGDVEVWGNALSPKERIIGEEEASALIGTTRERGRGVVAVAMTPLEKNLLADARDFRLNRHLLIDALLIASGANTEPELNRFRDKFHKLTETLRRSGRLSLGGPRDKARAILETMHTDVLSAYTSKLADIRQAFETGEYNCVTASALFLCLAERFGLRVSAEDRGGHVLTRLRGGGESFYIETTLGRWFRMSPIEKQIALRQFAEHEDGPRREMTRLGLVAMMYFNRGALMLEKKLYREAISESFKAACIDPGSPEALDNLICAYTKLAFHLTKQKRYDEALRVVDRAKEFDPYRLSLQVTRSVIDNERTCQPEPSPKKPSSETSPPSGSEKGTTSSSTAP